MIKADRTNLAFIAFITIIGLLIRLANPLASSFPLNDGGLFYAMTLDVAAHQFALPFFTTYNAASIPFAYPPLAFYFYALINTVTHIPALDLIRLLPAIISSASIPAFYLLAEEMLDSKIQILLATTIFALIPRAFDWLIMGGGVTRSLGLLFALLAMRQAYILFKTDSIKAVPLMIVFGSLVVYTHPEATTHTILSAAFFYLWKDRSRRGFLLSLLAAFGILLVTAPWWATVLSRYGISPFIAAADAARQDSYNVLAGLFALFQFEFTDEPFVMLIGALSLIGIFFLLSRKDYFLPLWLVVMHIIEPRGGALFMTIPLAMFVGIGLDEVILPGLNKLSNQTYPDSKSRAGTPLSLQLDRLLQGPTVKLFLGFVFLYGIMSAYWIAFQIKQGSTLTNADLEAFNWVGNNATSSAQFALVTEQQPLRDPYSEWFPAITGRKSVATVFGYEWINDGQFEKHTEDYRDLQACANQNMDCLNSWAQKSGKSFTYVFIHAQPGNSAKNIPLATYLQNSSTYEMVYSAGEIEIFRRK